MQVGLDSMQDVVVEGDLVGMSLSILSSAVAKELSDDESGAPRVGGQLAPPDVGQTRSVAISQSTTK